MMQTIPLGWSYLKVIYEYLSKDTSEIGLRISNICIFSKWPPKKQKILIFISVNLKTLIRRPNVHLKGQEMQLNN